MRGLLIAFLGFDAGFLLAPGALRRVDTTTKTKKTAKAA